MHGYIQNIGREFEALYNNAAIGIIVVNDAGLIILANQFLLDQFGYEENEVLGQKIELLIPPRADSHHIKHRENYHGPNAHSRPMGLGMDLFAMRKDGQEFPVEVSLSPYKTENGQNTIAFVSDISIRKRSEEDLLKLNAELEQIVVNRTRLLTEALEKEKDLNELKSRFVSMASHEFRTPLSTILSSAYLVSKYTDTEDQHKRDKHIDRIVSGVNMLTDILNEFLSVGKIEEGRIQLRFSDFNIEEQIKAQLSEMQTVLKEEQYFTYVHSGETSVRLDLSLLKHIIMNLLSNAIKFSPASSEIVIRTENAPEQLSLSVADFGIGISEADQAHLFERFFRGANVTEIQGTGLGLHIVSKYAELMNGTMVCNSRLDKGTEFIIHFKKDTVWNETN
jgi:PAS domain S-box-containing protein